MPRPRALIALFALLLVGLSACTKNGSSTEDLPAGATLIAESAAAMQGVQSAHVRIDTEGEVSSLPMRRAEGDLLKSGDAKGSVLLSQFGALIEYEFVVLGDSIYLKGVTGGWQQLPASVASTVYDPSAILDPDRGIAKVLSSASDPTTEAKEQVDGKDAYRVKVALEGSAVSSLVPGVGNGITGTLWLDATTKHLIKAVLSVPNTSGAKPGTVTISVSAIDVPVTVSAP
ncbi:MAG TPA: LppX_LprAFG lipoprotein [Micromonosporaceae bacterium]